MPMQHKLPAGRVTFGVTRMAYRVRDVIEVVGNVRYEPSMVRVRFADGHVERVFREHLNGSQDTP